jgi:xanthine dehydrogenase accessory factor
MKSSEYQVLATLKQWLSEGRKADLVTVVSAFGSSPRPVGSIAAVRDDGKLVGSVSGGCVEQKLVEHFSRELDTEKRLYEINDGQAREFGLPCGGKLELMFERIDNENEISPVLEHLDKRQVVRRVVDLRSNNAMVSTAEPQANFTYNDKELIQVFGPTWRVLLIGAGELSAYVAEFAQALDFDVKVVDPRAAIRTSWRLKDITVDDMLPDDAVSLYASDARSAVMALSHDPELDDLALRQALPSAAFYVGALGSASNNERRLKRLAHFGLSDVDMARLHGPIGLKIHSRTSAEIAISILSQLISIRALARNG